MGGEDRSLYRGLLYKGVRYFRVRLYLGLFVRLKIETIFERFFFSCASCQLTNGNMLRTFIENHKFLHIVSNSSDTEANKGVYMTTMEPRFNEVLDITTDILCPGLSYSKMYGIEPSSI